jgi:hypothetical protein
MMILLMSGALKASPVLGKSNESRDKAAAKIKQKITRLGVDAPLVVKLADARKLNGQIAEINDESFVIRAGASGDEQVINYSEVRQVNYVGSTGGANLGPAFLVFIAVVVVTKLLR